MLYTYYTRSGSSSRRIYEKFHVQNDGERGSGWQENDSKTREPITCLGARHPKNLNYALHTGGQASFSFQCLFSGQDGSPGCLENICVHV